MVRDIIETYMYMSICDKFLGRKCPIKKNGEEYVTNTMQPYEREITVNKKMVQTKKDFCTSV